MGLRAMLKDMGHGSQTHRRRGRATYGENRPDLAIMDIQMPGWRAVAQAIAERCPLPVVMLSAYVSELVERANATATVQAPGQAGAQTDLGPVLGWPPADLPSGRPWRGRRPAGGPWRTACRAKRGASWSARSEQTQAFLEIQGRPPRPPHHAGWPRRSWRTRTRPDGMRRVRI